MRRLPAVLAAALIGATLVPSARGEEPPRATLSSPDGGMALGGSFTDVAGLPLPEACTPETCRKFALEVALPGDVWQSPDDGVQVSVDWHDDEVDMEGNDLDLFVYGPGGTRHDSTGFFASTGEAVRVRHATNGDYRIVVAARFVAGTMPFHVWAEVERGPAVAPVRELLPDLVPLEPRNATFHVGAYLTDPGLGDAAPSCYPEEMAPEVPASPGNVALSGQNAKRCLRFDQIIANQGEGPFELVYEMSGIATEQRLLQRVYSSDGGHADEFADTYEFHPAHAHFHYKNFGRSFLWEVNAEGDKAGEQPLRQGRKNGFCMIDVENTRFGPGGKGEAPRTYYFPRCNAPEPGQTEMVNGISVGWADVYNWYLADQFIEVDGVANGVYLIETVANPATATALDGTIRETTRTNNSASAWVCIQGDSARIVQTPSCQGLPAA